MQNKENYPRCLSDNQLEERHSYLDRLLNNFSHSHWEDRADNLVGPSPVEVEFDLLEDELERRFNEREGD